MSLPNLGVYLNLTARDKIIFVGIMALVVLIPTGSYVLSLRSKTQSSASEYRKPVTSPIAQATASSKLQQAIDKLTDEIDSSPTPEPTSLASNSLVLGPTLGFKLKIQGRPAGNQSSLKMFLGIAEGEPQLNPHYLISFLVDVPASGEYSGISLAGLDEGSTYTAYLKGSAQIATSSAFVVRNPSANLGTLNMLTGDVNEDNTINQADYDIVKKALGTTPSSESWNPNLDFNKDNVVNGLDLSLVIGNIDKTGQSGVWQSTPVVASGSATFAQNSPKPAPTSIGGPEMDQPKTGKGYWMWMPLP